MSPPPTLQSFGFLPRLVRPPCSFSRIRAFGRPPLFSTLSSSSRRHPSPSPTLPLVHPEFQAHSSRRPPTVLVFARPSFGRPPLSSTPSSSSRQHPSPPPTLPLVHPEFQAHSSRRAPTAFVSVHPHIAQPSALLYHSSDDRITLSVPHILRIDLSPRSVLHSRPLLLPFTYLPFL
ncbi:hypothetical protein C8R43DRAFT_1125326 [Mycena crocata]|nr:hypothetical protein C8R43DRAFT_1125326 [Mycena crocata]